MRTTIIPSSTIIEDIGNIEEVPGELVRFLVGKRESNGNWIIPQQFETFLVANEQYTELNGPPQSWCPDKPTGTYRNEDLWHYVDLQRNSVNS
jgi:hypothetical protein